MNVKYYVCTIISLGVFALSFFTQNIVVIAIIGVVALIVALIEKYIRRKLQESTPDNSAKSEAEFLYHNAIKKNKEEEHNG